MVRSRTVPFSLGSAREQLRSLIRKCVVTSESALVMQSGELLSLSRRPTFFCNRQSHVTSELPPAAPPGPATSAAATAP